MKFLPSKPSKGETRSSVDVGISSTTASGLLGGKASACATSSPHHILPIHVSLMCQQLLGIFSAERKWPQTWYISSSILPSTQPWNMLIQQILSIFLVCSPSDGVFPWVGTVLQPLLLERCCTKLLKTYYPYWGDMVPSSMDMPQTKCCSYP